MQTTTTSQQDRKRKFYLFLPVIIIPCLTLCFYALGGGKGEAQPVAQKHGLNTLLPNAQMDTAEANKMTLYAQSLKDSAGLNDLRKADPYNNPDTTGNPVSSLPTGRAGEAYTDPNEQKVNERLAVLQHTLNQPQPYSNRTNSYESVENEQLKQQLQAVQEQMRQMNSSQQSQPDPQMEQINTVLNKIMDVQHPESVKERLEQQSLKNHGQVFSVAANRENVLATPMAGSFRQQVGFYGLTEKTDTGYWNNTAVMAFVNETQTLTSGATVKLRLASDILVAGQTIPKGSFVFGTCAIEGERLIVTVTSVRSGDRLFPVSLAVYDMDGLAGIRIPGAITRDATKEGVDQGIQSMNLMTLDPSVGAQAASAAVQTAKSLFSRKIKLVKATVRAGYPVLLVDKNKQQHQ